MLSEIIIPLIVLSANAFWDMLRREILLSSVLLMGAAGVVYRVCYLSGGITVVFAALIPGAFLMALSLVTRDRIGKGDALLSLCLGEWLGFADTIFVIFIAASGAAAAAAFLWGVKKRDTQIPFVPFLLAGYILQLVLMHTGSI